MAGVFRAENGSGLYASTEVSSKQLVGLLAAAHKDYRIGPDLVASLHAYFREPNERLAAFLGRALPWPA